MQYIQFQPQNATQVPAAPSGAVNFFVDASDNNIKVKDLSGNTISSGNQLITLTKSEMDELLSISGLTNGNFYQITGVHPTLYGGTNIILQATSKNTLSRSGWGLFYNPNYSLYSVWDNKDRINIGSTTGFFEFNENIHGDQGQTGYLVEIPGQSTLTFINTGGNWSTTTNIYGDSSGSYAAYSSYISQASYSVGQKVIWGGIVWENLTGGVGNTPLGWPYTQVYLDNTNWTPVFYNTTDYKLVCDIIEYQYEYDNISYRRDDTNEVYSDYIWFSNNWGYNNINRFPWGHPNVLNVTIKNSYLDSLVNFPNQGNGYIVNVSFDNGGGFNAHNWGVGTQIYNITSDKGGHMISMNLGDYTEIYNIKLKESAYFNSIFTCNNDAGRIQFNYIEVGGGSNFSSVYLYPYSYIQYITMDKDCTFEVVYLYYNTDISDVKIETYGYFGEINFGTNSNMYDVTIGMDSSFSNIQGNDSSSIYAIEVTNNSYFSNIYFYAANSNISYVNMLNGSYFEYIFFNNTNSGINNIMIGLSSGLNNITFGRNAYLENVSVASNTELYTILLNDGAIFQYITLENNCIFNNITLNNNIHVYNIKIGAKAYFSEITINENLDGAYVSIESSTFPITIDITNANSINMGSYSYAGIITLTSSNSTETLTNIINGSNIPQKFQAANGLTVTFSGTPVGSITSGGQIIMPTSSFVVNGSNFDFITFDTVFNGTYTLERKINGTNNI
jgi:hypothetical protein